MQPFTVLQAYMYIEGPKKNDMNTLIASTKQTQKETLSILLQQHFELKMLIDSMFARAWDSNSIEPLLEIRSLNSKTISKYQDLISNQEVVIEKSDDFGLALNAELNIDLNLWEINAKLAKMIPVYQRAISNINLSSFVRMLVSITMEKLVLTKENLIHPINLNTEALSA